SGLEREKIEGELAALVEKIADYKDILSNGERLLGIIKTELSAIRAKFNDERRTQIEAISGEVDIEDLIPYEDCVITMTNFGYVKRQKVDTYRTKRRGGRGISGMNRRAEDVVSDMFVAGTHDYVLFFTNLGKVYRMKCYMIPEGSRTAKGMNINNLLTLAQNEKVTSMIRIPEEGDEGMYLVMITKKGLIKRTATQSFHSLRNKGGLIALGLEDDDELVWVRLTDGHSQLLIATRNGMAIRIDENEVRNMSRVAKGVKAIRLRGDDQVIGMSILREDAYILTVSEKGYGRLSPQSDYRIQSRGGHGLINYHTNKFGKVAAIKAVDLEDDIILISDNGIILRISASSIRICARPSKGVILMKMNDESKIVTLSRAPHEEEIPDAMNDADDDDDDDDESL
ncbi:MAG TPA: DNA gyrase subunit A, partial [Ruminococcaceae bacterium]|nr:DNA gyrase subunit A [Oscillospiraceae bacterium]